MNHKTGSFTKRNNISNFIHWLSHKIRASILCHNDSLTAPQVVKAWLQRGGLRADVLTTGTLRVGMKIKNDK